MSNSNGTPNGTHRTPEANIGHQPNTAVPGYHTYMPLQPQTIGSLLPSSKFPQNANAPPLFQPITIRGVEFANRMWVAPMCQYSSDDGKATDHHFVHLGSMAFRGWGNISVEATAVVPEGRITPEDSGIWSDAHIPGFKRIVDYVHGVQGKIGIQLAHAGRKASTQAPWVRRMATEDGWKGGQTASAENHGWPDSTVGPSAISFDEEMFPHPIEASKEYIANLKKAFLDAVERCKTIGFDYIELHGAHGYLLHEFASPISNRRTDEYGGSYDNRVRLPLEITKAVREAWDGPLFYRISTSDELDRVLGAEKNQKGDWVYWGLEQTTMLTQQLSDLGVDLISVSSGGNDLRQHFDVKRGYMVPYAEHVKANTRDIVVGAVGVIVDPHQANTILEKGQADIVFMARQVLRDIDFPLKAAETLGPAIHPAVQYERAWGHMVVKREACHHPKKHDGHTEVEGEEGKDRKDKIKRDSISAGSK